MASSSPAAAAHGETKGAMSAAAGTVCCMCGDHGLADELFRCRCCRARLQHRYCSDLYPRAAAYRRCNWCLRAPAPAPVQQQQGGRAAAAADDKPEAKRKTTTSPASAMSDEERQRREGCSPRTRSTAPASDEERRQRHDGWSPRSRLPPAVLGHLPVKKKHRAEEKTPLHQPGAAAGKEGTIVSTGASGGSRSKDKEAMRAGKPRINRVRVRRYKLLTEVISC